MASKKDKIVEEANSAYELQLQVVERLRDRKNVNPYQAGLSVLSSAIRFAAVFEGAEKSRPFFEEAWKYLKNAHEGFEIKGPSGDFDPEIAYRRMRVFWGLSGLSNLLEKEGYVEYLEEALDSLRPAFSDSWSSTLKSRIRSGIEDLTSISVVQLVFLGLMVLAKNISANKEICEIDKKNVKNALSIPVCRDYSDLRDSLGALAIAEPTISAGSDFLEAFERAYREMINPDSYENGLVAGLTFVEAWLMAVVRNDGDFEAGAIRLFNF